MIAIRVDSRALVLYPDAGVDLESVSPILSEASIPDDFSLPMRAPVRGNEWLHVMYMQVMEKTLQLDGAEFILMNSLEGRGTLSVLDADEDEIELSITIGPLALKAVETNLRDVDYGDPIDVGPDASDLIAHAIDVNSKAYPEVTHCFPPHKNESLYSNNDDWNEIVNYWDATNETFPENAIVAEIPENKYAMVPFFYSAWILERAMRHLGYTLKGDVMQHADFLQMVEFNNTPLDTKEDKYYVHVGYSPGHSEVGTAPSMGVISDDETTKPFRDDDDVHDHTTGYYNCPAEGWIWIRVKCHVSLATSASLTVYLHEVGGGNTAMMTTSSDTEHDIDDTYFWGAVAGDVGKDYQVVIYTTGTGSITVTEFEVEFYHITQTRLNVFADEIVPAEHVPDQTIGDYLLGLKLGLGIGFVVDSAERTVELKWLDPLIANTKEQPKDLSPYVASKPRFEFGERMGFTVKFNGSDLNADDLPNADLLEFDGYYFTEDDLPAPIFGRWCITLNDHKVWSTDMKSLVEWYDPEWQFKGYWHPPVVLGDGREEHSPDWSPMMMDNVLMDGELHLMPVVDQSGNSSIYPSGYTAPELRKAYYRGMQTGPINDYPLCTPYNLGNDGKGVGNDVLRFGDTGGIYELRLRNLLQHLQEPEFCVLDLLPTIAFLNEQYYLNIYVFQNVAYLIQELPVSYKRDGVYAPGVRLLKLKPWID